MAATGLHRLATADRTEHQATVDRTEPQATVVLVERLVPAAEVVATVAEVVMLRVGADIPPVAGVDTPAVAAVVDIPVAAALPAVIAKAKRRCEQRLA